MLISYYDLPILDCDELEPSAFAFDSILAVDNEDTTLMLLL